MGNPVDFAKKLYLLPDNAVLWGPNVVIILNNDYKSGFSLFTFQMLI